MLSRFEVTFVNDKAAEVYDCGICLEKLKKGETEKEIFWPTIDKQFLIQDKINFVIQINGKTRGILNLKTGLNEGELLAKITNDDKIRNYIKDKTIKNKIFIPDKLINIII